MIRLVFAVLAGLVAAIARRLARGPAAPGWSWRLELVNALQRSALHAMMHWEPARMRAVAPGSGSKLARKLELREVSLGGVRAEQSQPPGREPERCLLYIHGGGYVAGSIESHRDIVSALSLGAQSRTWSLDYRLAPEHRFPAAVDDCLAAYRALLADGVDPKRLVIAGDSAGGGLCLALLQRLREEGDLAPAGAVLICPAPDAEFPGESWERNTATDYLSLPLARTWLGHYLGETSPRHPWASPIHADLTNLPPMLVQAGTGECLYDDIAALVAKLEKAGVAVTFRAYDHMPHDWHLFRAFLPEAEAALDEIAAFARERTPH